MEVVCETEISVLSGKSFLDVHQVGVGGGEGGAGVTRLEPLWRGCMIVTQRTYIRTILWCGSRFVILHIGTMGMTFAARCMCTNACSVSYGHSRFLGVRLIRQLSDARHHLLFLVSPLALIHGLSTGAKITEQLFCL